MTMGPSGNYENDIENGKNSAKNKVGNAANVGANIGNTAEKAIKKAKAAKAATDTAEKAAKKTLKEKIAAILKDAPVKNVGIYFLAAFLFVLLTIIIGMSASSVLQQVQNKPVGIIGFIKSSLSVESLMLGKIEDSIDGQYNKAIKQAKDFMITESNAYGCEMTEVSSLAEGEVGYENGSCKLIMIMGPKEVTVEDDPDNPNETEEEKQARAEALVRSSYSKQGFVNLISSRMYAVTGTLNKFNNEAVFEGTSSTNTDNVQNGGNAAFTDWRGANADDDEEVKDSEDTEEANDSDVGEEQQTEVADENPSVEEAENEDEETDTEEAEEEEKDSKQSRIDYSKMDGPDYLPSVMESDGTEYTAMYSKEALEYFDEFCKEKRDHVIWVSPSSEWESETEATPTTYETNVCESYHDADSGGLSNMWTETESGCIATSSEPIKRPKYANASYFVGEGVDEMFANNNDFLYWNDTVDFFKHGATQEDPDKNKYGINYRDEMAKYGFTDDDIIPENGALKCFRGEQLLSYIYPDENRQNYDMRNNNEYENSSFSINCTELKHVTATVQKQIITFYIPFYYDMYGFHGEEVENVKKAVQYKDPENILDQEEASKYIDDMIDSQQRQYASQYGFEDTLDTVKMKQYTRSSHSAIGEIGDVKVDFGLKYYTFSNDLTLGNPNVCDPQNIVWPLGRCDPASWGGLGVASTSQPNKMICCSYAAGRYWEVNYPDDPFPLPMYTWQTDMLPGGQFYNPNATEPVEHSILCMNGVVCHVAFVEKVFDDGSIIVSECNLNPYYLGDSEAEQMYGFRVGHYGSIGEWVNAVHSGCWFTGYIPPDAFD